jgi:DNA-binding transcriptional LysR family regulator
MDKLRAMRTFVAIAEAGSLTAAARVLRSSLPAVVRLLAALEAELGARLFHRTTRRIALTDPGRRYLERCRTLDALLIEAEAELRAEQSEPRGRLTVTAPVLFGTRHIASGVLEFVRRYPEVRVEFQLLDRVVNLLEEGIDVGIRIGELEDSSLIARPVSTMRRVTVAAPSYLARHGSPQQPKDLHEHNCIGFSGRGAAPWTFIVNGKPVSLALNGNVEVNQTAVAAQACTAGLGIGTFFAYQVADELAQGVLEPVLASFQPPPRPIHVVYPEARLLPARTRIFIDFIMRHIQAEAGAWQLSERGKPGSVALERERSRRAERAKITQGAASRRAPSVAKAPRGTPRTK